MRLEDIKTGDFLYYTERPHSNYADSLIEIRLIAGVNHAHPVCTNWGGQYINETADNWGNDLPIAEHFDEKCWHKTSFTGGDAAEWMTKHYPLGAK